SLYAYTTLPITTLFFFFPIPSPSDFYTLSLHDALPICFEDIYVTGYGGNMLYHNNGDGTFTDVTKRTGVVAGGWSASAGFFDYRSEEHTSELQSLRHLVCRLLLEKKKKKKNEKITNKNK